MLKYRADRATNPGKYMNRSEDPIVPLLLGIIPSPSPRPPCCLPYTSRHLVFRTVVKRRGGNNLKVHSKAIQCEHWQLRLSEHYC